jgi:hypothetical protein
VNQRAIPKKPYIFQKNIPLANCKKIAGHPDPQLNNSKRYSNWKLIAGHTCPQLRYFV